MASASRKHARGFLLSITAISLIGISNTYSQRGERIKRMTNRPMNALMQAITGLTRGKSRRWKTPDRIIEPPIESFSTMRHDLVNQASVATRDRVTCPYCGEIRHVYSYCTFQRYLTTALSLFGLASRICGYCRIMSPTIDGWRSIPDLLRVEGSVNGERA